MENLLSFEFANLRMGLSNDTSHKLFATHLFLGNFAFVNFASKNLLQVFLELQ